MSTYKYILTRPAAFDDNLYIRHEFCLDAPLVDQQYELNLLFQSSQDKDLIYIQVYEIVLKNEPKVYYFKLFQSQDVNKLKQTLSQIGNIFSQAFKTPQTKQSENKFTIMDVYNANNVNSNDNLKFKMLPIKDNQSIFDMSLALRCSSHPNITMGNIQVANNGKGKFITKPINVSQIAPANKKTHNLQKNASEDPTNPADKSKQKNASNAEKKQQIDKNKNNSANKTQQNAGKNQKTSSNYTKISVEESLKETNSVFKQINQLNTDDLFSVLYQVRLFCIKTNKNGSCININNTKHYLQIMLFIVYLLAQPGNHDKGGSMHDNKMYSNIIEYIGYSHNSHKKNTFSKITPDNKQFKDFVNNTKLKIQDNKLSIYPDLLKLINNNNNNKDMKEKEISEEEINKMLNKFLNDFRISN